MIHLRAIRFNPDRETPDRYPFNVPSLRGLEEMTFDSDVTFFVGENGSGKSTLLEAIACAAELPTIGAQSVKDDPTLKEVRELSRHLRWSWSKRVRRGFFMRSEDFFGFAKRIQRTQAELREELAAVDAEYTEAGRSQFAWDLARGPIVGQLHALEREYGAGLDAQSHGESYFKLFQARFIPDGIYLLDEPEAPLSPARQLTLLSQFKEMVKLNAQFIIATHSPLVLAYPGATIYSFDNGALTKVAYTELEHFQLTRDFLNNPEQFFRHLFDG